MLTIQKNIPLAALTTLGVGGSAAFFAKVRSLEDLKDAAEFLKQKKIPFTVLGEGSNVLIGDAGYSGLILQVAIRGIKMKEVDYRRVSIEVGAGENWDDAVSYAVTHHLYGLENLSGIPGSVGAAPVQNIGAYGTEVRESISEVEVFDMISGEIKIFTAEQCQFSYRNSIFKKPEIKNFVITKVSFILEKDGRVNIGYKDLKERFFDRYSKDISLSEVRKAVLEIRARKLPDWKILHNAGSFFKNPIVTEEVYAKLLETYPDMPSFPEKRNLVKIPLAWILDNVCDLRGWKRGKVGTHDAQPLVLVNYGGATAQEIEDAAVYIAGLVKEETGITLEWEVQKIG